jgi:hypothetical protein
MRAQTFPDDPKVEKVKGARDTRAHVWAFPFGSQMSGLGQVLSIIA